jgi:hypothetical protein
MGGGAIRWGLFEELARDRRRHGDLMTVAHDVREGRRQHAARERRDDGRRVCDASEVDDLGAVRVRVDLGAELGPHGVTLRRPAGVVVTFGAARRRAGGRERGQESGHDRERHGEGRRAA